MNNTVWVLTRAKLDGVLFRTKPSQDKKKTKTDNSCIIGYVNVTGEDGQTRVQKCYGVIQKFYLHFMYPPKKSTYKLTREKLLSFEEPWILCALCDWYDTLDVHSSTGLVQIQRNNYWEGCPLQNLATCYPTNIVYWPTTPFNPDDYDDKGKPIEGKTYDFKGDGIYSVIAHHEKL